MFRFFRYSTKSRFFFFRKLTIGIRLVSGAFKAVTFNHKYYFIFCTLLTFIQVVRMTITSFIDPNLSAATLVTEFLAGRSFFEIIIDSISLPISLKSIIINLIKIFLFFIEVLITLITGAAVAYYSSAQTKNKNYKVKESFFLAIRKYKALAVWAFFEVLMLFLTALMGFIGNFVYFFWQLSTALTLQVIIFQNISAISALKHALKFFKHRVANILGIDLLTDVALVVFSSIFYYFYTTQFVSTFDFLVEIKTGSFLVFIILYYITSIVYIAEIIALTGLYKLIN